MQENLLAVTSRPKWNDEMLKELALIVGKYVNEWCNNETPLEDCVESAEKVLHWNLNEDGYRLAKEFEDEGFESDPELVEILERVFYDRYEIQKKHEQRWVKDNGIKLEFALGSTVSFMDMRKKAHVTAEIVKLYPEDAKYGVWYEGLGYVKEGGHTVIPAEKCTLVS